MIRSKQPTANLEMDVIEAPALLPDDPYRLLDKKVSEKDIDSIQANSSRQRRQIKKFYRNQNELIDRLTKTVDQHVEEARQEQGADLLHYKIAQHGSLAINILLAILQVYAAVGTSTGGDSYSVFATAADAIFDPLSNLNLYLWNRVMARIDKDNYPGGKSRFENVGNIIFCWIMSAVSAVLIAVSSLEIANTKNIKGPTDSGDGILNIAQVVILSCSIVLKTTFMLICFPLKERYSQIHTLFADHRNDIIVNVFGLFSTVAGRKIAWWIDPAGAIIISVLIIGLWCRESVDHFKNLVGVACDTAFLQQVTHTVLCHATQDILAVDTVRAWHSGPRLLVEVDIVMDPDRTVREAHDIAEDLQMKLERLPNVERAYVHIDYETSHAPEHFLKKVL